MNGDIFGNLLEWNRVPEQIAELTAAGRLDEHQAGLLRLLRYPDNWRLREIALRSLKNLRAPSNELLAEVLSLAANEEIYLEVRILAAEALADLIAKRETVDEDGRCAVGRRAAEEMRAILHSPGPPVLHDAIRQCLTVIQSAL